MAFAKTISRSDLTRIFVKLSTPVIQLIETFSAGIHRVPVVDDTNQILNFISQSDVLRYLAQNVFLMENGDSSVDSLGLVNRVVHYVRDVANAVLALSILATKRVSAIPVLDSNDRIVGTFSASDLKGIGAQDYPKLQGSLKQFLEEHNFKSLFPLTCFPSDTLEYVLFKLVAARIHRLWVVSEHNNQLIGVLSITDVMRAFVGLQPMEVDQSLPHPTPSTVA